VRPILPRRHALRFMTVPAAPTDQPEITLSEK
jgi:hypothetical protein